MLLMKKLFYVANVRMPTERVHGIQIVEMCKAFSKTGVEVELIVPNRKTFISNRPFKYYDISEDFKITKLWCLDTVKYGWLGYWIQTVTFAGRVVWYLMFKEGIFYTREELVALLLKLINKDVTWEAHQGQTNILVRLMIKLRIPFVTITQGLEELYKGMGMGREKILVAADAADTDRFDIDITRDKARKGLGLPLDKKIILYKGSLGKWKGVGTLAEAAQLVRTKDTLFVFIGGVEEDVIAFKNAHEGDDRMLIRGNRPRKETPIYQKAADILIIPNSAKEDISKLYTSPLKLFGYMAGGVPIIASDLPSLREVLDEDNAYFFKSDDAYSLAETIDLVLFNYSEAQEKSTKALEMARFYSWDNRARKILAFIDA
jgi:glycosyltransferase involved in cell wall biosynthesis